RSRTEWRRHAKQYRSGRRSPHSPPTPETRDRAHAAGRAVPAGHPWKIDNPPSDPPTPETCQQIDGAGRRAPGADTGKNWPRGAPRSPAGGVGSPGASAGASELPPSREGRALPRPGRGRSPAAPPPARRLGLQAAPEEAVLGALAPLFGRLG